MDYDFLCRILAHNLHPDAKLCTRPKVYASHGFDSPHSRAIGYNDAETAKSTGLSHPDVSTVFTHPVAQECNMSKSGSVDQYVTQWTSQISGT